MPNELAAFRNSSLAKGALGQYKANLAKVQAAAPQMGGVPILKLGKDSIWRYGQKQTEVQEGSIWAINPLSLHKGFVAWSKAGGTKPLGKSMANVLAGHLPLESELPPVGANWSANVEFELKCTNGDDEGLTVKYASNALGGVEAFHHVIAHLMHQMEVDPDKLVPLVALMSEGYQHSNLAYGLRGWIAKPIFDIVDWVTLDGGGMTETSAEDGEDAGGNAEDSELAAPPQPAEPPAPRAAVPSPQPARRAPVGGAPSTQPAAPPRRAPVEGSRAAADLGRPEIARPMSAAEATGDTAVAEPVVRRRRRTAAA
jgi:hypothetical protein